MSNINVYKGSTNAVVVDVGNLLVTDEAPTVTAVTAKLLNGESTIGSQATLSGSGTHWAGEFPTSTTGLLTNGNDVTLEVTVTANSKTTLFRKTVTVAYYTGD